MGVQYTRLSTRSLITVAQLLSNVRNFREKTPSGQPAVGGTLFSMTPQTSAQPGRNEPCHCGSGRKYKHCCLAKDDAKASAARAKAAAEAPAQSPEAVTATPARPPKPQTQQPWKGTTARGFIPRTRTPRKVGGS